MKYGLLSTHDSVRYESSKGGKLFSAQSLHVAALKENTDMRALRADKARIES